MFESAHNILLISIYQAAYVIVDLVMEKEDV